MNAFQRLLGRLRKGSEPEPEPFELAPARQAAHVQDSELPRYAFSNPTLRLAAIGDIHGRIDLLHRLGPELDRAAAETDRRLVEVYLGDYVDHAGDPRAVIDYLIARKQLTDRDVVCLVGNHEQMMLAALRDDKAFSKWLRLGGIATLQSYGVSMRDAVADKPGCRRALAAAVPDSHVAFLESLRESYSEGGFHFVHAGVRPGVPLDRQVTADTLWIRDAFLTSFAHFGATIVHGHTPTETPVLRANRIGMDTGAYKTGVLSCLFVTSDAIRIVDSNQAAKSARH